MFSCGSTNCLAFETMNVDEALKLAEQHIGCDMVVLADTVSEREFGFHFHTDSKRHQETGRWEDLLCGSCGVLVERATGEVHDLGSAFGIDYWFEAYRRGLHRPLTVVITKVFDRQRAAEALHRLQMTYVIPEEAYGETWVIPQPYTLKDFRKAFDALPARYENQNLIFRLHDIERIESERDVEITLEPYITA